MGNITLGLFSSALTQTSDDVEDMPLLCPQMQRLLSLRNEHLGLLLVDIGLIVQVECIAIA